MITNHTWIISDTHFGHKNIIDYCNRPHNNWDIILNNWHENVQPNDVVLHLGDVLFKDKEDKWINEIEKLPGQIYFIRGNHDHTKSVKTLKNFGWKQVDPFMYQIDKEIIKFSHYPCTVEGIWNLNIHGHIHNNDYPIEHWLAAPKEVKYFNASIEVMGYRLWRLKEILIKLNNQF